MVLQVCLESPDGRRIYWTPPATAWSVAEPSSQDKGVVIREKESAAPPPSFSAEGSSEEGGALVVSELQTAVAFSADKWSDSAWLAVYLVLNATDHEVEKEKKKAEEEGCRLRLTPTARIQISVHAPKHSS